MSDPVTAAAIMGGGSLLGGIFGKGKKTEYTNALSPQAQGVSDQMGRYISAGLNKPIAYANVNPMAIQAMDMISRMFMGQGYSQPNYGMSAQGGGPSGMGMPQQTGPQTPYGMPSQMPGRQFYGPPPGYGSGPRRPQ
jgi:hypothetical protein